MRGIARLLTLAVVVIFVVGLGMVLSNTQERPGGPAVSASPTTGGTAAVGSGPASPGANTGESDRGARRIVAGEAGEKYYTPDHYESFLFIIEGK
jgi:hypothetical protein